MQVGRERENFTLSYFYNEFQSFNELVYLGCDLCKWISACHSCALPS